MNSNGLVVECISINEVPQFGGKAQERRVQVVVLSATLFLAHATMMHEDLWKEWRTLHR
jgi:predicted dinucleotide-utilizing enzyme